MAPRGEEIELKFRLPDARAFAAVLRAASRHGAGSAPSAPVRQINHFFDTPARVLRRLALGLRLREEPGRWLLTAKGGKRAASQGALSVRREEEVEIDAATAAEILAGTQSPLAALAARVPLGGRALLEELRRAVGGAPWVHIGAFENQRTRVPARLPLPAPRRTLGGDEDGAQADTALEVVLEFDETCFPGGVVHYEVELEVAHHADAEPAECALTALLAEAGVVGAPAPGKAARFFRLLEQTAR